MQSSILFLVLIGCIMLSANAKLSPFFNYHDNEPKPLNRRSRKLQQGYTVNRYGQKIYEKEDCESFYSKSHKKSKKSSKKGKLYKSGKNCRGYTQKPDVVIDHPAPEPGDDYKDFVRFIMVREEAGTPSPDNFGVGDTLALNGKIYFWEDYEDDLMSDIPVGTFVTLCTGISFGDDLMCTYEIVMGTMVQKNRNGNPVRGTAGMIDGVGAFVANGPNLLGENKMIITGTEFNLSPYQSGTLMTTEDLVNPYLYADLYLK